MKHHHDNLSDAQTAARKGNAGDKHVFVHDNGMRIIFRPGKSNPLFMRPPRNQGVDPSKSKPDAEAVAKAKTVAKTKPAVETKTVTKSKAGPKSRPGSVRKVSAKLDPEIEAKAADPKTAAEAEADAKASKKRPSQRGRRRS